MRTFYVTVEGLVSRVERVETDSLAKAMVKAKEKFMSQAGALNAVFVSAHEEKTKC
jgi:hypothetical protein